MDDEVLDACEAAWQRLERVSGLDRSRWWRRGPTMDADAHALLLSMPAVRAAHDEVQEATRALERAQRDAAEHPADED